MLGIQMLDNMDKVDSPLSGDDAIFSHMRPNGVRGLMSTHSKLKISVHLYFQTWTPLF